MTFWFQYIYTYNDIYMNIILFSILLFLIIEHLNFLLFDSSPSPFSFCDKHINVNNTGCKV